MSLTPGLGYKGMRVQIYKPPPLPSGTLTLNPSGVTKSLPVPTHRWPGSIPMGISISTCLIWIHVGFHWVTQSHKSKTHGFSSPLMRTWTRCFKKINQRHKKSLSACFKKYMNGQASFQRRYQTWTSLSLLVSRLPQVHWSLKWTRGILRSVKLWNLSRKVEW